MSPFELNLAAHEVEDGPLRYFRAEQFTVLLADEEQRRTTQLLQIQLRKNGQIFAQCPYFVSSAGLVGECETVVDGNMNGQIRLGEVGITTSHLVKYSHPLDGNAHFSQDGKVHTQIRRQSFRLDSAGGHLFEFHLFGLSSFAAIVPGEERKKRVYLPFATLGAAHAATVVGEWIPKARLREWAQEAGGTLGPIGHLPYDRAGKPYLACLLGHPNPDLDRYGLLSISVNPVVPPASISQPQLLMLGGWDAGSLKAGPGDSVRFLAFMYPAGNIDAMRRRLGSIDYPSE
ncbi:MAG: hypothetical protein JWM95_2329 [Gemmatimonadetes bacterium]|nr:hypothetical protein [Gemmatimonadota bacterium]